MDNFRCFSSTGPVRLAPITVLVGENSSGKTSFMAAVRFLLEAFRSSSSTSFNSEPYFLGSFEQIAHYRGGRTGRAKRFSLGIETSPGDQGDLFPDGRKTEGTASHSLTFEKGQTSQPELVQYSVKSGDILASFDVSAPKTNIQILKSGKNVFSIDPDRLPPSSLIRKDPYFLGFFVEDLLIRSRSERDKFSKEEQATLRVVQNIFRGSRRFLSYSVFASAPVRIQPRRVYTPSELTSSNAGEQVPLEMANQKLAYPEAWKKSRERMNEFGSRAGLFEDIEVKRFGRSDSDPFQIQIKNSGPSVNIADVGYGVSQALPLLYPLQNETKYGAFLIQQPEVHLHPKAQAEFGSLIAGLSSNSPDKIYVIETHSDFIVDRLRSEVRAGNISNNDVSILFFRKSGLDIRIHDILLNEKGDIVGYPEDYRDFFLREQARVLGI